MGRKNITGLNSEFSFFSNIWFTKDKEPRLPKYLPITEEENLECFLLFLFLF